MDIALEWHGPADLDHAIADNAIYSLPATKLRAIPETAGIYVFARVHGRVVAPLYIGKARNLRKRIKRQFNNLRLMRGIENAAAGYRTLYFAEVLLKQGQQAPRVITIVEQALISAALAEGYDILNIQGTKTLVHSITSRGSREARRWLTGNDILLRRGA